MKLSPWSISAMLGLVSATACSASHQATRAAPDRTTTQEGAASLAGSQRSGRWLTWAGDGRTWGTFVTADGAGPLWPVDVAERPKWSTDGRWLTSCASDFVAARWMGSTRPSRIALLNGGCTSLSWAPRGDVALAFSQGSKDARLLSFTAGEQPRIREDRFEIALAPGERLYDVEHPQWSPSGQAFLVKVDGSYLRWVDAGAKPGLVRKLLTPDGLEAVACLWSPSGSRLACAVAAPGPAPSRDDSRRALVLFELGGGGLSSRLVFESPGFWGADLSFVDDERLVLKDRDATRLLHVSGSQPPITLSATAGDFAVSPVAPRLAYVNHRGLCLREAGKQLGPEQLLAPGPLTGVQWSSTGDHVLSHRPDSRAALVVTEVGTGAQRASWSREAPAGSRLSAEFSPGGTLLLTRSVKPHESSRVLSVPKGAEPLRIRSLRDGSERQLGSPSVSDQWLDLSPDDGALVARRAHQPTVLYLGLTQGARTTQTPLGVDERGALFSWQPGKATPLSELPTPSRPTDPHRQRVTLEASHPISLATAFVRGSRACSGALLDPYFVVTAHHCIEGARGPVDVVLGRHTSWERKHTIQPYRIISHPRVRHLEALAMFENDLALLELPEPAPTQAKPLALARAQDATLGAEVFLAGYGGDWSVGLSPQPELRHGISRLVEPSPGITGVVAWRSAEGAENGGCFGDSGGPVVVRHGDGSFALLGIYYGTGGTNYTQACKNTGMAGNLVAERAWLNEAADKLTISRRGAGPPRARANPF